MKNIGIVGQGFVGTAVNEGLAKHYKIETYDIAKGSTCSSLKELHDKCDVIFVCLPTPMKKTGECHLGIIEPVLEELNNFGHKIIVIKSTIPPRTTERWNKKYNQIDIVFNPEFLTEANSIEDFKNQNRIIVGGERPATTIVARIYKKVFPKVPIIKTGSTYAEMVKYVTNCFLATKVSFANEINEICEYLNIDYDKVIEYAKHDDRLGYSHWNVPGPDGDVGYGGHCFPKDVKALTHVAMELESDIKPIMLQATDAKNNLIRKNKDWLDQKGRAVV
jgi:UDPglucose 6-dehydrogenase|tara:strand:+ start:1860 stop:2690 length:831 start_codon:yes stop_codon:yes gene_type:complete